MQRISININVASTDARNVRALLERVLSSSESVRGYSLAVCDDTADWIKDYERKTLARIATTMAPR